MRKIIGVYIGMLFVMGSCSKAWLDERSDKTLTTPNTVADLQRLLDNSRLFNGPGSSFGIPEILEISADNHIMSQTTYDENMPYEPYSTNAYIFAPAIFAGQTDLNVWNTPYKRIFTANLVLDKVKELPSGDPGLSFVKAQALFYRAYNHYWLAQAFMEAYDSAQSASKLGIPLKLVSDPNAKTTRATMQETYTQIIADAATALTNLPARGENVFRASAAADAALLARVYLAMRNYEQAGKYADTALQLQNQLLDYNDLDTLLEYAVPEYNDEVIFSDIKYTSILDPYYCVVDTTLYASFSPDDLRSIVFFKAKGDGIFTFNGGYDASSSIFFGIANDEVYLIRAECRAKQGLTNEAMDDLNHLLEKRWRAGTFIPLTASDAVDALRQVRQERRKELCFRGMRWVDLKRLNKEGAGVSISHFMNNQLYVLPPNDNKWVFPIPDDVIRLTGIPQNIR